MEEKLNKVYSKQVIEFVAVANEFCVFLESSSKFQRKDYVDKLHKFLPFIYLKATMLPVLESISEDGNEHFVKEEDWNKIKSEVENKMGGFDTFLEVFHPDMHELDDPLTSTVSENIADIYQDIKNFLMLYRLGIDDVMNDAIWECRLNFEQFWGQKVTNVMRALHNIFYSVKNNLDEEDYEIKKNDPEFDTDSWIISQKQKQFREGDK